MRTSGGFVCESATSATELGEWARCFETAETILRVEIDDQENEDLSRCAKSTAQSIIVSLAQQHGCRGDLTLGTLQEEHFKWYKGQSGSEPGLVIYSLEESGSEMDECVEMLVVETARRASRIITSGDKRGTLLARSLPVRRSSEV